MHPCLEERENLLASGVESLDHEAGLAICLPVDIESLFRVVTVGQLLLERKVIRAVRHVGFALFATGAIAGCSETGSDARAGTQCAVARDTLVECWAGASASG